MNISIDILIVCLFLTYMCSTMGFMYRLQQQYSGRYTYNVAGRVAQRYMPIL